ncbi:MAG: phosphate starvation-inducible protein PhoH [Candidatus Riflebacteria bacterium HGW-Riflebacteria-1]|jgi:phosphate starvation-inducible PhoH-like protein|nr:MAG: phosphate starvation-inducible protein PhoH [Candidatus Riflebacteria bacterium HGW-Riflebacteria-1]
MSQTQEKIDLSEEASRHILGAGADSGLLMIRGIADLSARARGNCLILEGPAEKVLLVKRFIGVLERRIEKSGSLEQNEMRRLFDHCAGEEMPAVASSEPFADLISSFNGRLVRAMTAGQQQYVDAIEKNTVIIARGPAGTGKTFLATAMAIKALKEKRVSRVILSRPVVEAGESLGYLPGDLKEKVDPHFRPLYDCLQEFIGMGKFEQYIRQGVIEITPLAYMRGRTFNEAFVVLDEAQNTTMPQMRMILTRLGYGAKLVITGDHTQIDLPRPSDSSLLTLADIIGSVESVSFIDLCGKDVIRHEVVRRIISAFDAYQMREKETK